MIAGFLCAPAMAGRCRPIGTDLVNLTNRRGCTITGRPMACRD
jgi:hypothetical protein